MNKTITIRNEVQQKPDIQVRNEINLEKEEINILTLSSNKFPKDMKYVTLVCLMIGLFCSTVSAQTDKNMIDVEYDFFGSRIQYSVSGKKLLYKDIKIIMENYPEPKTHLEKATKRRNVAIPLLAVGGSGMISSFFLRTTDSFEPVFWSSFGVFIVGANFYQGYLINLQRSVNTYNQNLYNSTRVRSSLDLKISPSQTGFIYSF